MEFLVLDFETACRDNSSICQAGLVEFNNGEIITHIDEYINPQCEFDMDSPYYYNKHGISANVVKDALTFGKFYPKLKKLIQNKIVFNHNMSDKKFFEAACSLYSLEIFEVQWLNSLTLVKRAWKDLEGGHSIENLAKYLQIKYIPHNAASDCYATAKIIEKAFEIRSYSIDDWLEELSRTPKRERSSRTYDTSQKISGDLLKAPNLNEVQNKENPFYNKKIVVSGKYNTWPDRNDLALLLKKNGADIDSNVGKYTDILCAGNGVGPKKIEKMQKKIDNGKGGQIIDENKILELLKR